MPSAAEIARDRLIEHDIALRRFIAGHQKEVDEILRRLERAISAEIASIDVAGAKTPRSREKRVAKLDKRVNELTKEAYAEIRKLHRQAQMGAVRAETRAVVNAIEEGGDAVR